MNKNGKKASYIPIISPTLNKNNLMDTYTDLSDDELVEYLEAQIEQALMQIQINQLEQDILNNKASYTWVDDESELRKRANDAGFTDKNNTNTMHISLDEMYSETTIEKIPSNWFNDICEFFSNLVA